MAEPAVISCTQDQWNKVLTNYQNSGKVLRVIGADQGSNLIYHTYRLTGNAAPTEIPDTASSDAALLEGSSAILNFSSEAIDLYIWPSKKDVRIRVDL